ncbi:MAG: alkaline phosphatase family protein [Bernardetiaceae bacterium]|nr:alkaline phosphatase family protein [Bernardetiaceae bacterium]
MRISIYSVPFFVSILFLFFGLVSCFPDQNRNRGIDEDSYLILISIDGYRYDYTELFEPPTLTRIKKEGAWADLIPMFPTKTFPNHYSIVTGLHPQNHGIVSNSFYDPERKETYSISDRKQVEDGSWYGGVPIWTWAQRRGIKTASYFWVGSDAAIGGNYPDYYYKYDGSVPNEERVDQVVEWLKLPKEERPRLILLYFSDVDKQGHQYGPESEQTKQAVLAIDSMIHRLRTKLAEEVDLPINTIIVSDHGMIAQQACANRIDTRLFYDADDFEAVIHQGTQVQFYLKDSVRKDDVMKRMRRKANESKNVNLYERAQIPEHWQYNHNPRIGNILLKANSPFFFSEKPCEEEKTIGTHGYESNIKQMHGIFYATGPNIRPHTRTKNFKNIDLFPLYCSILEIPLPDRLDGHRTRLESIFISNKARKK